MVIYLLLIIIASLAIIAGTRIRFYNHYNNDGLFPFVLVFIGFSVQMLVVAKQLDQKEELIGILIDHNITISNDYNDVVENVKLEKYKLLIKEGK